MDFEIPFFSTSDYELTKKELGKGSFAQVFIVQNKIDEKLYAVKIINHQALIEVKNQKNFLREISILTNIQHPAIVQFYGINLHSFSDPSIFQPSILMDYMKNGSLRTILNKENDNLADADWNPTKKYICLLGISNAMKYLHKKGILHRDLKPENILIDENYYPKVCDFGLSRFLVESLSDNLINLTADLGTPLYMAPELLKDEEWYGKGVDVYAFALIAYEIVTGQIPFSKNGKIENFISLSEKIQNGQRPKFNEGVSEKMQKLISLCWSNDANERPSFEYIFNELSSDFSYFLEDIDLNEVNDYILTIKEKEVISDNELNSIFFNNKKEKNKESSILELTKLLVSKISNIKELTNPGI